MFANWILNQSFTTATAPRPAWGLWLYKSKFSKRLSASSTFERRLKLKKKKSSPWPTSFNHISSTRTHIHTHTHIWCHAHNLTWDACLIDTMSFKEFIFKHAGFTFFFLFLQQQQMLRWLTFKWKIIIFVVVSYISDIHTSHTVYTLLDLFNVCRNHAPLNYSGQESTTICSL